MAADGKYLTNNAGQVKEERAVAVSAGAADANKMGRLNALGQWDESFLPNAEVQSKTAAENLSAGNMIHVTAAGEIEKANATTNAKPCSGFVKTSINISVAGNVYGEGIVGGFVGLTIGGDVFLATTAGGITQTAPSASGNIVQKVGVAWSATEVKFEVAQAIELV